MGVIRRNPKRTQLHCPFEMLQGAMGDELNVKGLGYSITSVWVHNITFGLCCTIHISMKNNNTISSCLQYADFQEICMNEQRC